MIIGGMGVRVRHGSWGKRRKCSDRGCEMCMARCKTWHFDDLMLVEFIRIGKHENCSKDGQGPIVLILPFFK